MTKQTNNNPEFFNSEDYDLITDPEFGDERKAMLMNALKDHAFSIEPDTQSTKLPIHLDNITELKKFLNDFSPEKKDVKKEKQRTEKEVEKEPIAKPHPIYTKPDVFIETKKTKPSINVKAPEKKVKQTSVKTIKNTIPKEKKAISYKPKAQPLSLLHSLHKQFKRLSASFKKKETVKKPDIQTHSGDDALQRMKDREKKLQDLLNEQKGKLT